MAGKITVSGKGPAQALQVEWLKQLADAVNEANGEWEVVINTSGLQTVGKVIPGPTKKILHLTIPGAGSGSQTQFNFQLVPAPIVSNPARMQVRAGSMGGVWPSGMFPGDTTKFYLTISGAPSYIVGKLAINSDGTFGEATVTAQDGPAGQDGNNVYLDIGVASYSGGTLTVLSQDCAGSQGVVVAISPDGTLLSPCWSSMGT
jgi:hypothetical protein